MEAANRITMECGDRTVVFETIADECAIRANAIVSNGGDVETEVVVNLETAYPAIEGGLEHDSNPVLQVSWRQRVFEPDDCVGHEIRIPTAYDEALQTHVTEFIYFEHLDFNDVQVAIKAFENDSVHLHITGTAVDPTDPAGPLMKIVADAKATFRR